MEEKWSVQDDRPYVRRDEGRTAEWLLPALVIVLVGAVAAGVIWWQTRGLPLGPWSEPAATPAQAGATPAQAGAAQTGAGYPLPDSEPPQAAKAKALPTLELSDSLARETLATLFGKEGFAALFRPTELVRRIVATVDNLPRETAPRRVVPLKDAPGSFAVAGRGEQVAIDGANFARYSRYVRALTAVDSRALVSAYVQAYPLFQRAYRELGYPKGHFNDRLIEAIDDMLAAPEAGAPIQLVRPKVLYEYADPDLETLSAGQKILLRMGPANAGEVKAKLREIRREIVAASEARRQ